jgi:hypothetical protein
LKTRAGVSRVMFEFGMIRCLLAFQASRSKTRASRIRPATGHPAQPADAG